jgi:hypothetical protein
MSEGAAINRSPFLFAEELERITKCALTPGGRHFVGYWTLRVKE